MQESEVTQSCPTLHDPMDCSLPGSSIHGIFQARVLEWGAIAFSRGSSQPRDQIPRLLCLLHWQADSLSLALPGNPICLLFCCCCSVTQSCPTLCDPMDCSLPGSSIHGIFQARVLEWVAISFTRGSSQNIGVLPSASLLPMNIQD